jgi:hypothetical protein
MMESLERMKKEILRLVKVGHHSAVIDVHRVSVMCHVPEKMVREEIAKLAEQKLIRVAGWDGREVRPYSAWSSAKEFVESQKDGGQLQVDLVEQEK